LLQEIITKYDEERQKKLQSSTSHSEAPITQNNSDNTLQQTEEKIRTLIARSNFSLISKTQNIKERERRIPLSPKTKTI
jgi:hypothetical protein